MGVMRGCVFDESEQWADCSDGDTGQVHSDTGQFHSDTGQGDIYAGHVGDRVI